MRTICLFVLALVGCGDTNYYYNTNIYENGEQTDSGDIDSADTDDTGVIDSGDSGDTSDTGDTSSTDTADTDDTADTGDTGDTADTDSDTDADSDSDTDSDTDTDSDSDSDTAVPEPCSDPMVDVFSDFDLYEGVRGGWSRLARFVFVGDRETLRLTDLTTTIASDDETFTFAFDDVPEAHDRILWCELRDWQGLTYGGPEYVHENETVVFEDLDYVIFQGSIEDLEVWCKFAPSAVQNGTPDGYTAYIASEDDIVLETALNGDGLTEANVCFPFGLPNEQLDSKAYIYDSGDLLLAYNGPLAGTMVPGAQDHQVLNLWLASMYEDIAVEEAVVTFAGDYEVVESVTISYEDVDGNWVEHTVACGGYAPGMAMFSGLDLVIERQGNWQDVEITANIFPTAMTGQSITATFVSWGVDAIGLDSGSQLTIQHINPSTDIVGNAQTVLNDECQYEVELTDGSTVIMANEAYVVISANSPTSGSYVPGYQEAMRFHLGSWHSDCSDLLIEGFNLRINTTDNAGSGWDDAIYVDIVDATIGMSLYSGTLPSNQPAPLSIALDLPPGAMHTISVYVDSTGASAPLDDAMIVIIESNSFDWSDWNAEATDTLNMSVTGGMFHF